MFIKKFLITRKEGDNGMLMFYKSVFLFVGFATLGPDVLTNNCNIEKEGILFIIIEDAYQFIGQCLITLDP